jgi:hypothetical protein
MADQTHNTRLRLSLQGIYHVISLKKRNFKVKTDKAAEAALSVFT